MIGYEDKQKHRLNTFLNDKNTLFWFFEKICRLFLFPNSFEY